MAAFVAITRRRREANRAWLRYSRPSLVRWQLVTGTAQRPLESPRDVRLRVEAFQRRRADGDHALAHLPDSSSPLRPTETVLYRAVQENLETFVSWARETYERPLPRYAEAELRAYFDAMPDAPAAANPSVNAR